MVPTESPFPQLDAEDEGDLIKKAQLEPAVFAELYRRHLGRIYAYLRTRVTCDEDAADLAQQVFLQAFDALPNYRSRPGLPFSAWLFQPDPLSRPFSFTDHLFYLHFLNDLVGWISMQPDHSFWATTNGGQSWHHLTLPSDTTQWGNLTQFNAQTWLFTTAANGSSSTTVNGRPVIYLTHDAGKSWQKQILAVPTGLSFGAPMENAWSFSASDGKLAVADGGADILIYTTHDGGDSWQFSAPLSPDIIQHSYEFGLPAFSSMNDGQFFLAPIPIYGKLLAPIYLIVTHDGGTSWQVITVHLPLIQQQQAGVRDSGWSECVFISPRIGWLITDYAPSKTGLPRSGLYKTIDGGHTWTSILYQIENRP